MRNIKFRGKDAVSGEWRYGFYYEYLGLHYIMTTKGAACQIKPETVGDYIGIKDVEENELYEGDAVLWQGSHCLGPNIYIIEWNEVYTSFRAVNPSRKFSISGMRLTESRRIGNKFDNPELLEKHGKV